MKIILLTTSGILGTLLLAAVAFTNLSPQLGGTPTKADKEGYAKSGHYRDGEFMNLLPTQGLTGNMSSVMWKFLFHKAPDAAPMLSVEMGPESWAPPKRYNRNLAITPEKLPPIAAVLISHDHYDHLDYQTIRKIKDKVGHFYVPLGVGVHLRHWGVAPARITEMNWGDSAKLPGLTLHCTPSRHFSGRGLTNRNSTLWCSWVMQTATKRVFYTGDGGYGPHFAAIGAAYGPFDLALVECGQYNEGWAEIHMRPEQSVQAARDVRATVMLPVHWGAFTEALHPWNEPVKRATAEAARLGQVITTPHLGEPVTLGAALPKEQWWK